MLCLLLWKCTKDGYQPHRCSLEYLALNIFSCIPYLFLVLYMQFLAVTWVLVYTFQMQRISWDIYVEFFLASNIELKCECTRIKTKKIKFQDSMPFRVKSGTLRENIPYVKPALYTSSTSFPSSSFLFISLPFFP